MFKYAALSLLNLSLAMVTFILSICITVSTYSIILFCLLSLQLVVTLTLMFVQNNITNKIFSYEKQLHLQNVQDAQNLQDLQDLQDIQGIQNLDNVSYTNSTSSIVDNHPPLINNYIIPIAIPSQTEIINSKSNTQ